MRSAVNASQYSQRGGIHAIMQMYQCNAEISYWLGTILAVKVVSPLKFKLSPERCLAISLEAVRGYPFKDISKIIFPPVAQPTQTRSLFLRSFAINYQKIDWTNILNTMTAVQSSNT